MRYQLLSRASWDLIARLIYSRRAAFAFRKRTSVPDGHGNAITRFRRVPYNEATSRRRVLRKQPDLAHPLKSKKAVTVTVAVASSMRASLTARFITPFLSAFTDFRSTERRLLFHPPTPIISSSVVLFSSATLYLKSIDTFMQYRLSNVTRRRLQIPRPNQ